MSVDGAELNNVTGSKQAATPESGLVLLASDDKAHRYFHAEIPLGKTPAAAVAQAPAGAPQPPGGG